MFDPLFDIRQQSIVIAGAASGIGRGVAQALAGRGALVTLADVAAAPLAEARQALGRELATEVADVTREADVAALMQRTRERFGGIDAVVNSAGVLHIAPALTLPADDFKATLDVNVAGAFLLSRAAAHAMQDKGGRIVHLASVSSAVSNLGYAAYAASKAALAQLVRVLAREWAPIPITVNAIGPAMTETGLTARYLADAAFRRSALAAIPLGRLGRVEDLIGPLLLLLSPAGAFITGQTIYVDGGRTLS
jgi:NAD(P)-dependent dehydrogenase (short-subunit alcohol dehydrogenase family)